MGGGCVCFFFDDVLINRFLFIFLEILLKKNRIKKGGDGYL